MVKRKFEQELAVAVEDVYLPHLVPEQTLAKKQKLPAPPKIGPRPFTDMKLSWDDAPEIVVRVMLDCGANVPCISEDLVGKYKIPGVLRRQACGFSGFDGTESSNAGHAYTLGCTLRKGGHYTKETFEISPLQDDHDILLPWWWILRHPNKYVTTGDESDLRFDDPKCVTCTAKAVEEFTVEYDDDVAYFGDEQKWIGVLGSLRFDDELNVELDVPEDQLKDIPWQYRDYQSVYNGQYSDELPPHRSFDH